MFAQIKAITYHLPEKEVTNEMLVEEFPNLSAEKIYQKTGIKNRYLSAPQEVSSDLAFASAEKLFAEYQDIIEKKDIDFLLFCTLSADHVAPSSAGILQERLGLSTSIGALDFNLGCTGFVYGLALAKGLVEGGMSKNCLLLTAEIPNNVIHPENWQLRSIFSDGAAATLISSSDSKKIGDFVFGTDGSGEEFLKVHHSGTREPITIDWLEKYAAFGGLSFGRMEMDGLEIFNFSLKRVPAMIDELLDKEGLSKDDIDLFIFHQANGFLLETLRRKMNIEEDKFFVYLENCGNTVSSTIPIAFAEAQKQNKINPGNKILIAGFGIGLSWSATIITI